MQILRVSKTQGSLIFDLFNKYRIFYKQESNMKLAEDFIQARLDNNESVIFVALETSNSKPIGFTQLYPKYSSARAVRNWILNDLYVGKEYRKHGVGSKLIETVINFAKEDGAMFVEISTAIDNFTAQSLYEQIGFKKQNSEADFYTYRIPLNK